MNVPELVHLAVLLLMAVAGFYAVWFKNLVSAVISLAVLSLLLSVEFYILQAPDVAIAEAGIGAGLTTAIFVIALRACHKEDPRNRRNSR